MFTVWEEIWIIFVNSLGFESLNVTKLSILAKTVKFSQTHQLLARFEQIFTLILLLYFNEQNLMQKFILKHNPNMHVRSIIEQQNVMSCTINKQNNRLIFKYWNIVLQHYRTKYSPGSLSPAAVCKSQQNSYSGRNPGLFFTKFVWVWNIPNPFLLTL